WLAFRGTYPQVKQENSGLQSVEILQTDDDVVVGAYYPQIVFFPSRERSKWPTSENLKPYLNEDLSLSWDKASVLLDDEMDRKQFHLRLRSIIDLLPRKDLKDRLESFCGQKFGAFHDEVSKLPVHPSTWEKKGGGEVDPQLLLAEY